MSGLTDGFAPVACRSCGTTVLVRKNSPQHTSVQWTSDPAACCPVFAAHVAAGKPSATLGACGRLADSIARAVAAGRVSAGIATAPTETEEEPA